MEWTKIVLLNLLLITLVSCASFKEKYSCNGTFKSMNKTYRFCKARDGKNWGLYSFPDNKEVISDDYLQVTTFSEKTDRLMAKTEDGEIVYFNISNQTPQKTNYVAFFNPPLFITKTNNLELAKDKDNNLYTHNDMGEVTGKLTGVSTKATKNEYGQELLLTYRAWFFDMMVGRFTENGKEYFQHFDTNGKLFGPRYPIEKVDIFLFDGHYYFFEKLGNKLHWPIFIDKTANKPMVKPKNIKGVLVPKNLEWLESKGFHDVKNQNYKYPSFKYIYIVYDENGKEKMVNRLMSLKKLKNWKAHRLFFTTTTHSLTEKPYPLRVYTNLKWHKRKEVNKDGVILEVDTPYYLSDKGKWSYIRLYNKSSKLDQNDFNTEEELLAYFNYKTENIKEFQKQAISHAQGEQWERVRARQQLAAEDARNKEAMLAKKRAAREYDRQRVKAESDAAWGRVNKKLQNAAKESQKKAKCLSKQTQTKKDYLDNKQGWYETGGCK